MKAFEAVIRVNVLYKPRMTEDGVMVKDVEVSATALTREGIPCKSVVGEKAEVMEVRFGGDVAKMERALTKEAAVALVEYMIMGDLS